MERKSFKTLLTAFFVIFLTSAQGQISKTFDPIDIFEIEYASDPQISPSGDKVLYLRNFKDIMTDRNLSNIWMVNFDGSASRPITTGNKNDLNNAAESSRKIIDGLKKKFQYPDTQAFKAIGQELIYAQGAGGSESNAKATNQIKNTLKNTLSDMKSMTFKDKFKGVFEGAEQ